jgi:hypothetical protein
VRGCRRLLDWQARGVLSGEAGGGGRGVWHLAKMADSCASSSTALRRQSLGGSGSSFSQATTKVRRHRRLIFLPSADSTSTRQGGAQGLRASQGTCASTPAQPPARMVSVRPVLDGGCSSSTTSSTLHLDDVINLRRGHRCACTSEVCSKSALRAPSDVNGMREVMTRRCA